MSDPFVPEHEPLGAQRPDPPAPADVRVMTDTVGTKYHLRRDGHAWEVRSEDGTILGYAAHDVDYGTAPTPAPDPSPYSLPAAIQKQNERIRELELSQASLRSMIQSASTIYLGYKDRVAKLAETLERHGLNEPSVPWSGRLTMLEHQVVSDAERINKAFAEYDRNFKNLAEWTTATQTAVKTYRLTIQSFLKILESKLYTISNDIAARDKWNAVRFTDLVKRIEKLEGIPARLYQWPDVPGPLPGTRTPTVVPAGPPIPGPTQAAAPVPGLTRAPISYGADAQAEEPRWPDPAGDFTINLEGGADTSVRFTNFDSDKRYPEGPSGNATEDLERMNMWFQATQDLAVSYLKESGIWEKAIAYAERQLDRDPQKNGSTDPVTWRSFMESIASAVPKAELSTDE